MMKIKPSIKVSFIIAMLVLGVGMSAVYSALMFHYYIKGLNVSTYGMMKRMANDKDTQHSEQITNNFVISESWEQVPENIRLMFKVAPSIDDGLLVEAEKEIFSLPTAVYFVLKVKNNAGEIKFISRILKNDDPFVAVVIEDRLEHLSVVLAAFVLSVSFFYLFTLVLFRKISRPVEKLGLWAQRLNETSLESQPPVFEYKELNQLAELIHQSLNSVKDVLNREHDFLRYASHELRTPITVLRTNIELLTKVNKLEGASDKQVNILKRIERASFTMGHLTEVLLWLGRDDDVVLDEQSIELDRLVEEISNELKYLLNGKPVQVLLATDKHQLTLSTTVCRIVLANLIRNAYQHTQSGIVDIKQQGACVIVENTSAEYKSNTAQGELGFGLGLQLTQKLIQKFGWKYSAQKTFDDKNHISIVTFS